MSEYKKIYLTLFNRFYMITASVMKGLSEYKYTFFEWARLLLFARLTIIFHRI